MNFEFIVYKLKGQSDEFQLSQEELRELLERSIKVGAQFKNLYEGTRTAYVGIPPEVSRLRAREAELITEVSTLQNMRDGVANTVAKSPPGACSGQCTYESKSDYKHFEEHQKPGIDAAVTDVQHRNQSSTSLNRSNCEIRWKESIYRRSRGRKSSKFAKKN